MRAVHFNYIFLWLLYYASDFGQQLHNYLYSKGGSMFDSFYIYTTIKQNPYVKGHDFASVFEFNWHAMDVVLTTPVPSFGFKCVFFQINKLN